MAMNSYYEDKLYPLQDKVLSRIDQLRTPFYLTGGTALSRCYFQHRFSDDLDLFVNQSVDFAQLAEKILAALHKDFAVEIISKTTSFYSCQIDHLLKVDLVNDVPFRFGELRQANIFSQVDNVENILSNKLSALISRDEPKDVADIWAIAANTSINWREIFTSANSKAVGIFPPEVARKLSEFPTDLLSLIKWKDDNSPQIGQFKTDMEKICDQMLKVD